MKLAFKKALPINLFKISEINKLKEQIEKYPATEVLNPAGFLELEFTPDLFVRCFNDIILIQLFDEYITPEELYFLATLSLSFKKKYETKNKKGEVIIVFFLMGEKLTEKHKEILRVAEKIFDMEGEIDVRDYEEIKEDLNFPNFLEHEIWYKYFAYFKKAKEKIVL